MRFLISIALASALSMGDEPNEIIPQDLLEVNDDQLVMQSGDDSKDDGTSAPTVKETMQVQESAKTQFCYGCFARRINTPEKKKMWGLANGLVRACKHRMQAKDCNCRPCFYRCIEMYYTAKKGYADKYSLRLFKRDPKKMGDFIKTAETNQKYVGQP